MISGHKWHLFLFITRNKQINRICYVRHKRTKWLDTLWFSWNKKPAALEPYFASLMLIVSSKLQGPPLNVLWNGINNVRAKCIVYRDHKSRPGCYWTCLFYCFTTKWLDPQEAQLSLYDTQELFGYKKEDPLSHSHCMLIRVW